MLWYKSWLETRISVGFALFYALFPVALFTVTQHTNSPTSHPPLAAVEGVMSFLGLYWAIAPLVLAGTGVKTQSGSGPQKGIHGSTLFTLSLPVSRLRLFASRAGIGLLEMATIFLLVPIAACLIFPLGGRRPRIRTS